VVFENILEIFVRHEYPRALGSPTGVVQLATPSNWGRAKLSY